MSDFYGPHPVESRVPSPAVVRALDIPETNAVTGLASLLVFTFTEAPSGLSHLTSRSERRDRRTGPQLPLQRDALVRLR
jgi:hypothetical protein